MEFYSSGGCVEKLLAHLVKICQVRGKETVNMCFLSLFVCFLIAVTHVSEDQ